MRPYRGPVQPAAVLWDMDGTLVDTEPYWIACEHELVAEFDGTWTSADAHSIVGFDLLDAAVELRDRGGVRLDPHAIVERLLDGVIARAARELPWRPGAARLLAECAAAGVPCALVTMSWRRLADAVIAAAPAGSFAASVTGDEVTNGKPDPEPYLAAAARRSASTPPGASPSRTLRPGLPRHWPRGVRRWASPMSSPSLPPPGSPSSAPLPTLPSPISAASSPDTPALGAGDARAADPARADRTRPPQRWNVAPASRPGGARARGRGRGRRRRAHRHPRRRRHHRRSPTSHSTPGRRTGRSTPRSRRPTGDSVRCATCRRSGSAPSA